MFVPSRSLSLFKELLRTHCCKLGDLVLWQKGTKVTDLYIEFCHSVGDDLSSNGLAIESEVGRVVGRVDVASNDEVGLTFWCFELDFDEAS